ncbi:MAG: class I SAM-dependent methyltransferase [Planctomycetaceae bacterium]
MAAKDFGPIEDDYAFFTSHSTEPQSDAAEYARELAQFADGRASIRMLDFGCGTGTFTRRFLATMNWPPSALELTLIEPVRHQREAAARQLVPFSDHTISNAEKLPTGQAQFDLILSNHALYYVEDLDTTLRQLIHSVRPAGTLQLAIAGWDNPLVNLWKTGFAILGRPVPYHTADDVDAALSRQRAAFGKSQAPYQLRFPDSVENRTKILRFLFGNYLAEITPRRLLGEFDRYVRAAHVEMNTHSYHFAIEPG